MALKDLKTDFDIIVVGSGIAGCSLAWQWHLNGKSVLLVGDGKKGSSSVAAGVYNPTILKRFTSVWKAGEQLDYLNSFYPLIEEKVASKFLHPIEILRRLHDEREVKTWQKKSQRPELKPFMSHDIFPYDNAAIEAPFNYGKVSGTGWVDTIGYMKLSRKYFLYQNNFLEEEFDYNELVHSKDSVKYKIYHASKIIFSEGFKMTANPFFSDLPLQGNKGEVLTVKIPGLQLDYIIKSSVFLMPYIDDLFWVGATYNRDELSDMPTDEAKTFLISRLERFLKLPYEIVDHKHGIRPTTKDRRPFVGAHKDFPNYMVFNGMGSRAVLMAPWAAKQLFDSLYNNQPLNEEININRFNNN
ncbi:glycine/D-amino acid oxidase-like deaminating enzyme [Nonlabens dokdonensis]|uniref:FAD dependent oxidoreductase n=2 Tax=Nonlabens dokdonensis TaxID=328515 RepID=L7W715_NONDD|nr:FAD-binding oxidoreductase [Nonlabens dokdonensis]AGC75987.1 FAD dependent oxidoreductase [Nonlabens dokdonensis DSW-6]PZX43663.1 glycine/D-amino acid oxidase-like deaminating enzyme [Nonlabens dokdonensis]